MVRKAVVAGQFYKGGKEELIAQIKGCFLSDYGPGKLPEGFKEERTIAVIAPHAGYMFSGMAAAWSYREISEFSDAESYIIIGPNHTGMGRTSVYIDDFETPLGVMEVDRELAREVVKETGIINNSRAHMFEHSVEVQLPFLQFIHKEDNIRFVPLIISSPLNLKEIGEGIARAIKKTGRKTLIIVSSDFTHYGVNYGYFPFGFGEDAVEKVKQGDMEAIEIIRNIDPEGFLKHIERTGKTICGYLPITVLLYYLKYLFKSEGKGIDVKLLKYYSSGDIINDYSSSVSYASLAFRKK